MFSQNGNQFGKKSTMIMNFGQKNLFITRPMTPRRQFAKLSQTHNDTSNFLHCTVDLQNFFRQTKNMQTKFSNHNFYNLVVDAESKMRDLF